MPKTVTKAKIEVFRSGTFQPMQGGSITYSADDLEKICTSYDPETAPAPVVIGHPKTDDPAFGWISGFEYDRENDRLFAEIDELVPEFSEAVAAGRYKKVSMNYYRPDAPNNPVPGCWYPKHVGFLGAAAPAVSGLKPVEFAEEDAAQVVSFEGSIDAAFGERGFESAAGLFRRLREWIIETSGRDKADEVLPNWEIDWLDNTEVEAKTAFAEPSPKKSEEDNKMSGNPKQGETGTQEAEFAEREKTLAEKEAAIAKREKEAREADNLAFVEKLAGDNKLLPAKKDEAAAILNAMGEAEAAQVSFADNTQKPLDQAFRDFLSSQPEQVSFGEVDMGDEPGEAGGVAEFATADGEQVDRGQLEIHRKALAFQKAHPGADYMTAVNAVS